MARVQALPLGRDGSARFLAWLVALMVYLSALAIAGGAAVHGTTAAWDARLAGTLTVELPRAADGAPVALDRVAAVSQQLRAVPGILAATPLDAVAEARLLAPWLGADIDLSMLPLPVLIDVQLRPGVSPASLALDDRLRALAPGARIEGNGAWLGRLFRIAALIQWAMGAIVTMIVLVAALAIIFVTRTGLAIHASIIELMHLIGASDTYIARQFQWHAFRLALGGGYVGLLLALASACGLAALLGGPLGGEAELLPAFQLPLVGWVLLILLPFLFGLVGLVTARRTVLSTLGRRL